MQKAGHFCPAVCDYIPGEVLGVHTTLSAHRCEIESVAIGGALTVRRKAVSNAHIFIRVDDGPGGTHRQHHASFWDSPRFVDPVMDHLKHRDVHLRSHHRPGTDLDWIGEGSLRFHHTKTPSACSYGTTLSRARQESVFLCG